MARMQVTHHYAADVETVFALLSDQQFLVRKYESQGATDVQVDSDERESGPRLVSRRRVTLDLPGFAKKVVSPTNSVVQTDEWAPADEAGRRVCTYVVEVQGVPSRIEGTLTLSPDAAGTRQDIDAEVKISIPLVGGRLEKLAVDNGTKLLAEEAEFTAQELRAGGI